MRKLAFIGLVLLIGCDRQVRPFALVNSSYGANTVIVAGQSNAYRLSLGLLREKIEGTGYIYQLAVEGSTLDQWAPGAYFYQRLVNQLRTARNNVTVIWMQGESEGLSIAGTDASTWGVRFTSMVSAARTDSHKDFRLIVVKIGLPSMGPLWDEVRQQQEALTIPYMALVNIDDVSRNDGVHYDVRGYAAITDRIAMAANHP